MLVSFDPFGVMPKRIKTVEKIVKVEGQTLHPIEDSVTEEEPIEDHVCPENIVEVEVTKEAVSYTHLTLPTIYSV